MKSRIISLFPGVSLVLLLSGCAGLFNPYNEEFTCKGGSPGKCGSTPQIYNESVADSKEIATLNGYLKPGQQTASPGESAYHEAEMAKVTKLLKQPVTPVVVPPSVMRLLFLPHQGESGNDDELNMDQFVYIIVGKPKFVMGDYLTRQPEE